MVKTYVVLGSFTLLIAVLVVVWVRSEMRSKQNSQALQVNIDQSEVKKRIAELGALEYAVREKATKSLSDMGLPALEELQSAEDHRDLETRQRVAGLIKSIRQANKLPTRVNGMEFKLVVAKEWLAPSPGKNATFDIALKITNTTNTVYRVFSYKNATALLRDVAGAPISGGWSGQAMSVPPQVSAPLGKNQSFTIHLKASVYWWDSKLRVQFDDEYTNYWRYDQGVSQGNYLLSVYYRNEQKNEDGDVPYWVGIAETLAESVIIK